MFKERAVNYSIGVFTILIGVIVLTGWAWDVPALRMVLLPDNISMKVNVAICLIFCGVSLMLYQKDGKSARAFFTILSALTLIICATSLSQDLFHYHLGIDELWVKDEIARRNHYIFPGRMAV